jgi:uncharacterized membrane protein
MGGARIYSMTSGLYEIGAVVAIKITLTGTVKSQSIFHTIDILHQSPTGSPESGYTNQV